MLMKTRKPFLTTEKTAKNFDFAGKTVLLVEDDELSRSIAENVLRSNNFNVVSVSNGKEAVDVFAAKPDFYFDAILMDVQMPEMDGIEASALIRKTSKRDAHKVPIIAVTSDDTNDSIEKCLASGMDEHIGKPIDATALLNILERYLDWKDFIA